MSGLLNAPADPPKLSEAAEKDLKKFEGKWKAEKLAADGNEETPTLDGAEFAGVAADCDGDGVSGDAF